jgi:hypothetical protein
MAVTAVAASPRMDGGLSHAAGGPSHAASDSPLARTGTARTDTAKTARTADAPASRAHVHTRVSAKKAPSKPPLASGSTGGAEEEASGSLSGEDPLVSNGLGSPLCHGGAGEGDLSRGSQSNCQTSGFEAAPAPTGDYAFDVHINTGVAKLPNDEAATFQDLLQLGWTMLVAAVHGVIVMLEWCYSIDPLNGPAMRGVARGLREARATFTQPWLVLVLTVASVLALYHGLVRRKVAETVGQALTMLAMMAGGLWVIVNPAGTVGALGAWANEAGLGTLGAVTSGTPDHPDRTLAESMRDVYSGAIEAPWCYMEFGSVGWCDDPRRLDPRLRTSGLGIALLERGQSDCKTSTGSISIGGLTLCASPGSAEAKALEHSAELLRGARTNGAVFLALPANGPMRNSLNDSGTLLQTLCGGKEEPCKGPTAAQAEFRTERGTGWRFIGLLFIAAGLLGMLLTLGFIALRLLGAAISSLMYLLLAPAAVLAPALGDGGRSAFRGWTTRLLSAVMSKLIYSFLLGVMLLMQRILTVDLTALGWFTQWLLVSAMWWGAFSQRHQVLSFAQGAPGQPRERQSLARRVSGALDTPRMVKRGAGRVTSKLSPSAPSVEQRRQRAQAGQERAKAGMDEQVLRTLEREHRDASATVEAEPEIQERLSAKRAQLERVRGAHGKALVGGEERRAAKLEYRAQRIEGELAGEQQALNTARRVAGDGEKARSATGKVYAREQAEERGRFLDAQAALPSSARRQGRGGAGEERDYAGSAGLAGYSREQYERLDARRQRAARLEIDRELALRKELNATAQDVATSGGGSLARREKRKADRKFDSTLEQRMRDGGHELPSSAQPQRSGVDAYLHDGRARGGESSVMRDAHEVATRRKRQLGRDRH